MAAHQLRLGDDAQHHFAVREGHLAHRKALRLPEQYRGQPGGRHPPHLHRDRNGVGVGGVYPQHGGVVVADAPQAVAFAGRGLPLKNGACLQKILFQRQPAHQGAVDGQFDKFHRPVLLVGFGVPLQYSTRRRFCIGGKGQGPAGAAAQPREAPQARGRSAGSPPAGPKAAVCTRGGWGQGPKPTPCGLLRLARPHKGAKSR